MTNLHDLVLFVEVARTRNFSAAGRNLGVATPTLSRRIATMETRLGIRLLDRTTRRVELTEAGQRYFDRCSSIVDEVRLAEDALRESTERPTGHLRVSMPVELGVMFIGPILAEFALEYPDVTFDLDLSSQHVDLLASRVDVALRLGRIANEQLIARRVGYVQRPLYASPSYLRMRGMPTHPAELADHDCLLVSSGVPATVWQLSNGPESVSVEVHGRYATNSIGMMTTLASAGAGIAPLHSQQVVGAVDKGNLVPVLPGWQFPPMPLHALTTSRLQPVRVKVLVDYLCAHLPVLL